MPKPYPKEFREDVVGVAQNRDEHTTMGQVAKDFGLHDDTLRKWLRQADLDAGNPTGRAPGPTTDEKSELRELRRRNRTLEQELEVMRRAAAYFGQAQLPSK
ncbi:transposase [Garicola koreensis]|uniref:Transposase-like protein n=1 Tax=Garicola koreensis TaxID=1262554 RepID=A0A7W5TNG1_9MICC|nr:transposase [Garicola koreensis]MBB3666611.1 transposase-like protein [Garicola koreensis]